MKLKHETTVIDPQTNTQVTTIKTFSTKAKTSEDFFILFFSYFREQMKIKNIIDIRVLIKFCTLMEYDSTKVPLPTQRRKDICEELGLKSPNLSNSLNRLKALGIISGDGGVYEINPKYAWRGKTDVRDKLLSEQGLEIKLKFGGKDQDEVQELYNPLEGGSKEFDN